MNEIHLPKMKAMRSIKFEKINPAKNNGDMWANLIMKLLLEHTNIRNL